MQLSDEARIQLREALLAIVLFSGLGFMLWGLGVALEGDSTTEPKETSAQQWVASGVYVKDKHGMCYLVLNAGQASGSVVNVPCEKIGE